MVDVARQVYIYIYIYIYSCCHYYVHTIFILMSITITNKICYVKIIFFVNLRRSLKNDYILMIELDEARLFLKKS